MTVPTAQHTELQVADRVVSPLIGENVMLCAKLDRGTIMGSVFGDYHLPYT